MPRGTRRGFPETFAESETKSPARANARAGLFGEKGRFRLPPQTAAAGGGGGARVSWRRGRGPCRRPESAQSPLCSGHPCGHPSLRSLAPPLRTRPAARGSRPVLGQLEAVSRSLSPPQIMLRRSSSPTSSIWCFLSWARLELKKVRPFLFSAIHLPAKVPS